MNYLVLGMEIALILVQVYQFHEIMTSGYRSLYTRIQKFLIIYVVCFLSSILLNASHLMFCDDYCGILDLSKRRRFYKNNRMVTGILSCRRLCISAGWSVYGIT